jgi:hypothetical protein
MQSVLQTALDQEGVTFTFDLPSILLEEAKRRRLPTHQLSDYLEEALRSSDLWSSAMPAHSARAAALFRHEDAEQAVETLQRVGRLWSGFAGYGTLALLSLANRCYEFGEPRLVDEPKWDPSGTSLFDAAEDVARNVRDARFREERLKLVEDCRGWAVVDIPDVDSVLDALSEMPDPDTRRVYKDYVTARWASPSGDNREGLKRLVPVVLADATTLDAVLGRLIGLSLDELTDDDVTQAIHLCANYFMVERSWERWSVELP